MKKCIYTLKDENEATFSSSEHIFPKSIGGTRTLPKDWVSDEFNALMSPLERKFSRDTPLITIRRMFEGPVGRKNHSGKFGVSFMKTLPTDELELGYIEDGKPIVIPQIIFQWSIAVSDKINARMVGTCESDIGLFKVQLKSYDDNTKFELIRTSEDSFINKISLGFINKRFYVGAHNQLSEKQIRNYLKGFLDTFNNSSSESYNIRHEKKEALIEYQSYFTVNIMECMQVSAKIAFNCLACIKGQNFVLRKEFNEIRHAIVTGENIKQYVNLCPPEDNCADVLGLFNEEHFAIFTQNNRGIVGHIGFFGGNPLFVILFSNSVLHDFGYGVKVYICDWKQKEEKILNF